MLSVLARSRCRRVDVVVDEKIPIVAVEPAADESLLLPPCEENACPAVVENVPQVTPPVPSLVPQSMPAVKERPMPSTGTLLHLRLL